MQRFAAVSLLCALAACGGQDASPPAVNAPVTPTTPSNTPAASSPVASGAAGSASSLPTNTAQPPTAASNPSTPASMTPVNNPGMPPSAATPTTPMMNPATAAPAGGKMLAMDECGLKTQFGGDEYCIKPPSADKGFQFHIGPSSYDNPEAKYMLQPGEENVVNIDGMSGNTKDVEYYYRQYRMRPGSHHVIIMANGRRIGGTQNLARDEPDNGVIPPENMDVGLPLSANTPMTANMHFYNFTEKPIIRELWTNYWYKDPGVVKEVAKSVFSMTGVTAAVAHSHVVIGATCTIQGDGRALSLYGHRHLSNVRFSIWHTPVGGSKTLVFEDYDSQHPGYIEFNSLVTNPMPNPMAKTMGGASGIMDLKQGDTVNFECEIVNDTDKNFYGANEASDDEMCILVGDTVGATVPASCTPIAARKVTTPAQ